jgi:hypothetical protein
MTYADAFEKVLTSLRERVVAARTALTLMRAQAFGSKDPNLAFERGYVDALETFLHDVERYKIDCDYCGGCGEQDASGAPCTSCGGRGWNNPIETEAA